MATILVIDRCPNCNSKERVSSIIDGHTGDKYTRLEIIKYAERATIPKITSIKRYYDNCAKCGEEYCIRIDTVT